MIEINMDGICKSGNTDEAWQSRLAIEEATRGMAQWALLRDVDQGASIGELEDKFGFGLSNRSELYINLRKLHQYVNIPAHLQSRGEFRVFRNQHSAVFLLEGEYSPYLWQVGHWIEEGPFRRPSKSQESKELIKMRASVSKARALMGDDEYWVWNDEVPADLTRWKEFMSFYSHGMVNRAVEYCAYLQKNNNPPVAEFSGVVRCERDTTANLLELVVTSYSDQMMHDTVWERADLKRLASHAAAEYDFGRFDCMDDKPANVGKSTWTDLKFLDKNFREIADYCASFEGTSPNIQLNMNNIVPEIGYIDYPWANPSTKDAAKKLHSMYFPVFQSKTLRGARTVLTKMQKILDGAYAGMIDIESPKV
jgi:hypothetical protein